jgi:hypothetical protein
MVCPFLSPAIVRRDDNRANSATVIECYGQPEKMAKIEIHHPKSFGLMNATNCCL